MFNFASFPFLLCSFHTCFYLVCNLFFDIASFLCKWFEINLVPVCFFSLVSFGLSYLCFWSPNLSSLFLYFVAHVWNCVAIDPTIRSILNSAIECALLNFKSKHQRELEAAKKLMIKRLFCWWNARTEELVREDIQRM